MLEIILIYFISKKIANIAEEKGYKRKKYIILTVCLYIAGEIAGIIIGSLFFESILIYLVAIVMGALCGTGISYYIVMNLKPLLPEEKIPSDR